jgi:hypothetical protein
MIFLKTVTSQDWPYGCFFNAESKDLSIEKRPDTNGPTYKKRKK